MSKSEVLSKLDQECAQTATKVKERLGSIGEMAESAVASVGEMASHAASNIGESADNLAASAGRSVQHLGEQIGRSTPHSGMLGSMSQSVARTVSEGGEYIESSKLSGMGEDLARVIRRNPIPTIFIAMGLGWMASRIMKR